MIFYDVFSDSRAQAAGTYTTNQTTWSESNQIEQNKSLENCQVAKWYKLFKNPPYRSKKNSSKKL